MRNVIFSSISDKFFLNHLLASFKHTDPLYKYKILLDNARRLNIITIKIINKYKTTDYSFMSNLINKSIIIYLIRNCPSIFSIL